MNRWTLTINAVNSLIGYGLEQFTVEKFSAFLLTKAQKELDMSSKYKLCEKMENKQIVTCIGALICNQNV